MLWANSFMINPSVQEVAGSCKQEAQISRKAVQITARSMMTDFGGTRDATHRGCPTQGMPHTRLGACPTEKCDYGCNRYNI